MRKAETHRRRATVLGKLVSFPFARNRRLIVPGKHQGGGQRREEEKLEPLAGFLQARRGQQAWHRQAPGPS